MDDYDQAFSQGYAYGLWMQRGKLQRRHLNQCNFWRLSSLWWVYYRGLDAGRRFAKEMQSMGRWE